MFSSEGAISKLQPKNLWVKDIQFRRRHSKTAAKNPEIKCHSKTANEKSCLSKCEKLKPLRFKLIFSMTQVTQSTNPSTMCTNTLKTKKLQLPNHVRFTSLFEKPLASLGQSALLLGTHGAVSYPDLRSAARTKHKARPV